MSRNFPIAVALVVLLGAAYVQGVWTERWKSFPELQLYADQLTKVPLQIGEWQGEEMPETDKRVLQVAGAVGSLSRVYKNDKNESVSIFVVCGRLKDVFFHTPDRCYPAAGFEKTSDIVAQSVEVGNEVAEFKTQTYLKSEPGGNQSLRIYWSYCGNGLWLAPDAYKVAFAGERALYKIYVVTPNPGRELPADQNPAIDFIRVLLPELNRTFEPAFSAEVKSASATGTPSTTDATPKS